MKILKKIITALLLLCMILSCFTACGESPTSQQESQPADAVVADPTDAEAAPVDEVDYASSVELDMDSTSAKQEVSVKLFIDGDTTHFYVPESVMPGGVLKARYLGINTPESTGKIEEYGKKASAFTKEKLSSATSIIIESDTDKWDADSTGGRYLVWVWYKTADSENYRNLNIEILQNGLAIANNSAANRYGETCISAINQAKAMGLNMYSGQPDPDYYYGEAVELTLKELRTNIEAYNGVRVAFSGVVTMNNNNSVYVEAYDAETDMYYGMAVYYGYNLNGQGLDILNVGNEVRIVGSVQYYEAGGTYQVSDLEYRLMKPDDPNNIQKLSEGNAPAYPEVDPAIFSDGVVEVPVDEVYQTFDYAYLAMNASVSMKGLYVYDAYTTSKEDSASKGAMTLYCKAGDTHIAIRTIVLYDDNGELITEDQYLGKTLDVRGLVDYYDGTYQIKVFSDEDLVIIN